MQTGNYLEECLVLMIFHQNISIQTLHSIKTNGVSRFNGMWNGGLDGGMVGRASLLNELEAKLASYPGPLRGGERAWYTLYAHARSLRRFF